MNDEVVNPPEQGNSRLPPLVRRVMKPAELPSRKRRRDLEAPAPEAPAPEAPAPEAPAPEAPAPEAPAPKAPALAGVEAASEEPQPKKPRSSPVQILERKLKRVMELNEELERYVQQYPLPTDVNAAKGVFNMEDDVFATLICTAMKEPVAQGLDQSAECKERWNAAMKLLNGHKKAEKNQKQAASDVQRKKDNDPSSKQSVPGGGADPFANTHF
jgi:hypothetical protein